MNGPIDPFLRVLQHELSWMTAHRQLRLRLIRNGEEVPLLLQRLTGTEAICGGIDYRLGCLASSSLKLPLKDLIALPVEVQIVTDSGKLRSVCGIVTEARAGGDDGGLACYHLVVRDVLAIMEKRRRSRIFRDKSELDIVEVLLSEWRRSTGVFAGSFEYEFDPLLDMRQFPRREQTMQYNESDAAFVRRLLKRRGISWYVRPGRASTTPVDPRDRTPAHTLVFFDATGSLPQSAAGTVRYHREDATDPRDVITSWVAERKLQPGSITRHSWDYENPQGDHFMTVNVRSRADQGDHGNAVAATLDDFVLEAPHIGDDIGDHLRLGQLRMERCDYEAKCFHVEGNVRDVGAGEYFELEGHPDIDGRPVAEREFVITELELTATNNLPRDLDTQGARLLARGRAPQEQDDDTGSVGLVKIRFNAVRRDVPIVPAFDPLVDLPHPQVQSAIVVGPPNEEVYCDELGRVKIRFPGMRAADHGHAHGAGASDSPADSAWVRVSTSWAGPGPGSQQQCGTLGLPRVGTEVLVSFLGGDPDKPVITGQVFNQHGKPPALSALGGLPGNRYQSGTRSHEVGGQRGNQLRFDDTRGQISAQLASDHGNSELNLGWLTHPRANGAGNPRGEGAELRSDGAVAIRGGRGVLLSATPSPKAEGEQLARGELLGLADLLEGVVSTVSKLAEQHAGDETTARLEELANKLRKLDAGSNVAPGATDGGAPIVAVTAPAGIMLGSSDSVAIGSEKKVNVASAGDAEISAGKHLFLRAARFVSAFAQLGIKLVAGRGNITVQTHQGDVEVKATGRIRLIAGEGIDLQAPDVRVVAQGAQTEWGNQNIVNQSAGQHVIKAAAFVRTKPGGGDPASPDSINTILHTDERIVLSHAQTGEPLPNVRYSVLLDDGSTVEGVTDREGRSKLHASDLIRVAKVTFFDDEHL